MDWELKGGSCFFLCRNQNIYVGNPMLMKTPSWQVTGSEIRSAQFPGFLTLSRCLFFPLATFFFEKVEKSLQVVLTPPGTFLPPFPPSVLCRLSPLSRLSVSTSNLWSGHDVQSLQQFISILLVIPVFSVYSRIWVRKYILCWLMGHHWAIYCRVAHHFFSAGWWLPAVFRGIIVWSTISKNMFCSCYKTFG